MNAWHEKADADYAFALPKSSVVDDLTHAVDKLALWRSSIFTMRRSILSNLSNSKLVINSPRESDDGQGSVLSSPMGGNMIEEFDESTPVESPKLKREVSPVGAGSVLSSVSGWFQREIKEDIAAIMAGCRGLKYERSVGNLASIF